MGGQGNLQAVPCSTGQRCTRIRIHHGGHAHTDTDMTLSHAAWLRITGGSPCEDRKNVPARSLQVFITLWGHFKKHMATHTRQDSNCGTLEAWSSNISQEATVYINILTIWYDFRLKVKCLIAKRAEFIFQDLTPSHWIEIWLVVTWWWCGGGVVKGGRGVEFKFIVILWNLWCGVC